METWRCTYYLSVAKIRSRRKRLHDEMVYDQLHHQQQQLLLQHHDLSLVRPVAVNGHRDDVYPQKCLVCNRLITQSIFRVPVPHCKLLPKYTKGVPI